MGSREPLPGWVKLWHGGLHLKQGGVTLEVSRDGYWKARANANGPRNVIQRADSPNPTAAQLAAEDAARAMVDEMVAALGGSVTWGESEVIE